MKSIEDKIQEISDTYDYYIDSDTYDDIFNDVVQMAVVLEKSEKELLQSFPSGCEIVPCTCPKTARASCCTCRGTGFYIRYIRKERKG